ncbi:MAG: UDP-3-O-(3-hydroxymyristoyl)glucosamine N-acyltransferase [Robiginitomaculum sp.]|nr:MAG: UDP-3-O-(3-hydroxymyristoyl)glucosamine N-acyltransferase [Robiginitomaculum sp.]
MVDTRFYTHLGPFPLGELLSGLDVEYDTASADPIISQASPLQTATQNQISYFEQKRKQSQLNECGASACFVKPNNVSMVSGFEVVPIISNHPRADFARILDRLYTAKTCLPVQENEEFDDVKICKGVVIGQGATIGKGTFIGPNTVIGPGVVIGENCRIGANTVIEFAVLGDNCLIHNGVIIGSAGFGVAISATGGVDIPHLGLVRIGDNVSLGSMTAIDRAMFGETQIGDGCKFDNMVHIAHNCKIGPHCMFAAQVGMAGSCVIGAGVLMGGKAGIADHITIGDGAMLSATASTMHDIPAGEVWSGIPALPIRQHMRQISAVRKLGKKKNS